MIAVTRTTRRLGDVARPAGGRAPARFVMFAIVPPHEQATQTGQLADLVTQAAGPTRCGPVVVDVATSLESAARVLSSPLTATVPARRLFFVQETLRAMPGAVLLTGHCPVLWAQTSGRVRSS